MYRSEEIIKWAEKKGIFEHSTPLKQLEKTYSEAVELTKAIYEEDVEEMMDGVGDVYVTLVIQCKMQGWDVPDINNAYLYGSDILYFVNDVIKRQICGGIKIYHVQHLFEELKAICMVKNLKINDCIDMAVDTILGRTGRMVNGFFVKD